MKEAKKETKTYRFESEVIKHAETNPLIHSFAEWACDRYRKEFMEIATLVGKMQTYISMGEDCKLRIRQLKTEQEKGTDLDILSPKAIAWLKEEAPRRIQRATFEGVYKLFCNTFSVDHINRRQFRLLVNRLDPETAPK